MSDGPRDVKPFVGQLTVPYFLDRRLVKQVMIERRCTKIGAQAILTRRWMKEKGRGNS